MAHFARIENNIVREVIVVNNDVIKDDAGFEQESRGISFCKSLFGADTQWVQTSYNGTFRGKYAAIGDSYNSTTNEFVTPEPTSE